MKETREAVPKYLNYKIPGDARKRLEAYDDADLNPQYGTFAGLNTNEVLVATEMASDLMSATRRSDTQLAADLGINRRNIHRYRSNPLFNQALGVLAGTVVRGKVMRYVALIEKHAEKDWHAAKFLMEWVGLYVPKMQHLNLNVSATASQVVFESSEEAIFAFIKKVKSMGWSLERIAEIYNAD